MYCLTCNVNNSSKWYKNKTQCRKCYRKEHRIKFHEQELQKRHDYIQKNHTKVLEARKKWYYKNHEERLRKRREYEAIHKDYIKKQKSIANKRRYETKKEHIKKVHKLYRKNNSRYLNFLSSKRRAIKLKRTPKWADLKAIAEFYKNCPEGYHVDHIVPLQGENVSGLHVLENLQYLPAKENYCKNNKFDGTLENKNWHNF